MEKFGQRETYTDANMIILIAALVTSNQHKTFCETLQIRISPVYTNIVTLVYNFKSLVEKKKRKSEIRELVFKIAHIA